MCGCKGKCGCNITSTTKGEKGDASPVASLGYKSYIALLTQTSTNAPTATVLQNTLGEVPTFTFDGNGTFSIISSGIFTEDKTWFNIANENFSFAALCSIGWVNNTKITIITVDPTTGTKTNTLLRRTPIEIRVYA